jgi:hypothetical protein
MYSDLLPSIVRDAWSVDDRDKGRYLAVLSDGRKGWVPNSTMIGDSVFLLMGAPFPLVARKSSTCRSHNMVGDAYLDGVQDTSYWEEKQNQARIRILEFT